MWCRRRRCNEFAIAISRAVPFIAVLFALQFSTAAEASADLTRTWSIPVPSPNATVEQWLSACGLSMALEPGSPREPFRAQTLVIPQGTRVVSARLLPGQWGRVQHVPVGNVAALVASDGGVVEGLASKATSTLPGPHVEVLGTGRLHGYHLVSLRIFPLRRDATGGGAVMTQGILELELEPWEPRQAAARQTQRPGRRSSDAQRVRQLVDNPEDVSLYSAAPGFKTPPIPEGDVDYAIVTSAALAPSFQRLADSRNARGLTSTVVTIEWIESNFRQGADTAETVRTFLKESYANAGLRYVLLGGDTSVLPTRFALSRYYPVGGSTNIPCDLYFAALDGNWNADADGTYGEAFVSASDPGDDVDLLPELAVGRAPVATTAQVDAFIDKVLEYESGAQGSIASRALMLSEVLTPDDWSQGQFIILDGARFSEDIIDDSFNQSGNSVQPIRLYENYMAYPGAVEETRAAALDSLESGNFGLVVHEGHGFFYNMSVGDANIFGGDAEMLTNASPFVLYALNCSSAAYDVACLLERFVQNESGGAVASIGSSRSAFPTIADRYQQAFFDEVYRLGNLRLGDAVNLSRVRNFGPTSTETVLRWTVLTYALLGDPTVELWRKPPATPAVGHAASLARNATSATVTVDDAGVPVPGARVTLRQAGLFQTAVTDTTGTAVLPLAALELGSLELDVNGASLLPYEASIPVVSSGANVTSTPLSVDDVAMGNGDGFVDAGETIEWDFRFENDGDGSAANAAKATLSIVDAPGVTILSESITLGDLTGGAVVTPAQGFILQIDPTAVDGARAQLEVSVKAGAETWVQPVELFLRAPELVVADVRVDDSVLGDGDGIAETGETVTLIVALKNYGSGPSGVVSGVLVSGSAQAQVVAGSTSWPSMGTKETSLDLGMLQVLEIDAAQENPLTLTLLSALGVSWQHEIELRPPVAPGLPIPDTSLGPDTIALRWPTPAQPHLHGFRVYRSTQLTGPFVEQTADVLQRTAYFVDDELPALTRFYYYISAVDSSGVESAPSDTISASTAPPELQGYPLDLPLQVAGHLAVGNLRGDGTLFAVVGSDLVHALGGDGSELLDGDSDSRTFGPISDLGSRYTPSGITLADLDGDLDEEIIASSWNTFEIYVFQEDGSVMPGWPRLMNNKNWGTPAVGDLDDDGDLEIMTHSVGGTTYVWHHDGSDFHDGDGNPATIGVFQNRPTEFFNRTTPALFDLDGDDTLEIIFGTNYADGTDNMVHAFRNDRTEAVGWPQNLGPGGQVYSSAAVGDLDDDGDSEIVLPVDDDLLQVWNADGTPFAGFPIAFINNNGSLGGVTPSPALADFDDDGDLEIVAVSVIWTDQAFVYLMDHDGVPKPGWPVEVPGLSDASPIVGDVNGDQSLDIVFPIGGGAETAPNELYALNSDGTSVEGFPIRLAGAPRGTPALTDLDLDGDVEIVLAGLGQRLHVWDLPFAYEASRMPWPTYHGDSRRTGVFGAAYPTAVEDTEGRVPFRTTLEANVPNPFNAATSLRFSLESPTRVDLRIYDARGKLVDTLLHDELLVEGPHERLWRGTDSRGRAVSSGVYFYRLMSRDRSWTRRMVLLK